MRDEEERIEPDVDEDSPELEAAQHPEPPHPASRFDAGTGQGTVHGPPLDGGLLEHPILDGSTQHPGAEATVPNPYRGEDDPALVGRQPALTTANTMRWLVAAIVATVLLGTALFLLYPYDPLWCSIGIGVLLVGLLGMLGVRASRLGQRARLRADAVLLAALWLLPLGIILSVMLGRAAAIW
ncbi:hypothetical protein MUN78_16055 [Leucobacter allii]|uniref:Uncharacterized protein n=1 Tax=Leucobacter allii TaxID=2932247 RepID=A0ABY4FLK0_9MICO|nr:hypothetical protein [Leucobacter allii]UOQ57145.1 hypothetical protein MUN78_16055 [Leucobacter allii]UOR01651.1 hypothetical protein MUN77_16295 [Leucobacter allii]